jgi:hypothetical protein
MHYAFPGNRTQRTFIAKEKKVNRDASHIEIKEQDELDQSELNNDLMILHYTLRIRK